MSSKSFTLLLAICSAELTRAENDIESLSDHITRDHATMDEMQRTITDLRRQNENLHDSSYLKSENERLYAEVRALKAANHKLVYGGSTEEETANTFMVAKGEMLWNLGNKIGVIKEVRDVSGWGLKVTKDWCEAYIARLQEAKSAEVSGPCTKRSTPVPAGVGELAKRSA